MAGQTLQPSDVLYRRLDILGVAKNCDVSSAAFGKSYLIFNTGNVGYPAPAKRIFVAYVIVEYANGSIGPSSNTRVGFGAVTNFDWLGVANYPIWSGDLHYDPPYVLSPTPFQYPAYNPVVYAPGLAFTVTPNTGPSVCPLATFTAVGWCE